LRLYLKPATPTKVSKHCFLVIALGLIELRDLKLPTQQVQFHEFNSAVVAVLEMAFELGSTRVT
jgi:hypothetical protein